MLIQSKKLKVDTKTYNKWAYVLFLRDAVRNRLVAETLEQRCNQKLKAIRELENRLATGESSFKLTEDNLQDRTYTTLCILMIIRKISPEFMQIHTTGDEFRSEEHTSELQSH